MLLVLRCLRWLESTLLGQFSAYFLWAVKMWPFFNRMLMAISSVCNRSSLPTLTTSIGNLTPRNGK